MSSKIRVLFFAFGAFTFLLLLFFVLPTPNPYARGYSKVIYDSKGNLLRVTLAPDQQFRFAPKKTDLPSKYVTTLLVREDKRFFRHSGVDLLALANSFWTNLKESRRIRGGSTITMQVTRLNNTKPRTYIRKLWEVFQAWKLEWAYSKSDLLKLYAAHVPMGGNTVGIEAASWRYFKKPIEEITWAEAALFCLLPNSPSLINLEKGRRRLFEKRNRLLKSLYQQHKIDSTTYQLSKTEPLPDKNSYFPFLAPHFTQFVASQSHEDVIHTTLDLEIQRKVAQTKKYYSNMYSSQGIHNIAILVAETKTGHILSYHGSQSFGDSLAHGQVDGIQAFRSTASTLKPFLALLALDRGPFNLETKLLDVPTFYGNFEPQNANKEFSGIASLNEVLINSLNVPSVRLLYSLGQPLFYNFLKKSGMKNLFRTPAEYGLPIILGGAEASLWELTSMYATLGNLGKVTKLKFRQSSESLRPNTLMQKKQLYSAGAAWLVLNSLKNLKRPGSEYYWHLFSNQVSIAWKTGTSYGQKDAWAIGTNSKFTIAVWVGNFDGEGNSMLSGAMSAGPVLMALFNQLADGSQNNWFEEPFHDLRRISICTKSGYPAGPQCPKTEEVKIPKNSFVVHKCPWHKKFLLDKKTGRQICSYCWHGKDSAWTNLLIYPPSVQGVLARKGLVLQSAPSHNPKCGRIHHKKTIKIEYPVNHVKIWVPRNLQGEYEKIVFTAHSTNKHSSLYWYLNQNYLGETVKDHNIAVDLLAGEHTLTVQDSDGSIESVQFSAYRK